MPTDRVFQTSLNHDVFERLLSGHPNNLKVRLLLDTIRNGAHMGFTGEREASHLATRNRAVTLEQAELISKELESDREKGHLVGWFDRPPFSNLRTSPVSTIEKKEYGVKCGDRIIMNMSAPEGRSVNDFTPRMVCDFTPFDYTVERVRAAGKNAWLAKADVKQAFKLVPVRPKDWPLLGVEWQGRYAFYKTLVFGARTSPPIWERVATALVWIIQEKLGFEVVHHVDDFLLISKFEAKAEEEFLSVLSLFGSTGAILAPKKLIYPTHSLPFVGIVINTTDMTLSLPQQRRQQIIQELQSLADTDFISRKKLQSVVGILVFAARVLPQGRAFLNRLLAALRGKRNVRSIRLSTNLKQDIRWWLRMLPEWSGTAMILEADWTSSDVLQLATDASEMGMGAIFGDKWFSQQWSAGILTRARGGRGISRRSMPLLELTAIATALAVWGKFLGGKRVVVLTDCEPLVSIVNKRRTNSAEMASLVRFIAITSCTHNFALKLRHIPGKANTNPDLLSRLQVEEFLANQKSTIISFREILLPGEEMFLY